MEEQFLSGFCRQTDSARTVTVEYGPEGLEEVDCCYESCVHRGSCEIGKAITALLESAHP